MHSEQDSRQLELASAAPSDEETVHALLVLVRRFAARPALTPAPSDGLLHDAWLTMSGAAEYASVSEDTLREWITSGQLRAGRVGRVVRVRRRDIDALLISSGAGAPQGETAGVTGTGAEAPSEKSRAILTMVQSRRSTRR